MWCWRGVFSSPSCDFSQFGFYDTNETVIEMQEQDVSWSKKNIQTETQHLQNKQCSVLCDHGTNYITQKEDR